jgi:hypothetical protein
MSVLHSTISILAPVWSDWRVTLFVIVVLVLLAWNGINRVRWDLNAPNIDIPEKRFAGYDARDLEAFKVAAGHEPMISYISILRGSDMFFAVALSAVTAWLWYRVAVTPLGFVWLNWAAWPFSAMALIDGVADVAEDLKLSAVLKHEGPVDLAETAAASTLTRLKIATLTLSLIGVAIFLVYGVFQRCGSVAAKARGGVIGGIALWTCDGPFRPPLPASAHRAARGGGAGERRAAPAPGAILPRGSARR